MLHRLQLRQVVVRPRTKKKRNRLVKRSRKRARRKDSVETADAQQGASQNGPRGASTATKTTVHNPKTRSPEVSSQSRVQRSPDIEKYVPTGLTPPSSRKASPAPSDHQYPSLAHQYPYTSTLQSHANYGAKRKAPYKYPTQTTSAYAYRASPSPHRRAPYVNNMNWTGSSRGDSSA